MAPLCILKEEEQTIDIFSPSVVTVTPFWLLLKIVLTLSFLRHDGEKCLFWVTHMLVFWGFYWKKYKKKLFVQGHLQNPFYTMDWKRDTRQTPDSHMQSILSITHSKNISFSSLQLMPMGLLSTTQKWKTLSEHVCAVSINGNVTIHEHQECVYDFPSLWPHVPQRTCLN